MRKIAMVAALTLALAGCAANRSADVYTEGASGGKVLTGTLLSARPVTIKASDKVSDNALGGLAGGATGVAVGSGIGAGSGNAAAQVGGAIIGAVAGALIQDALSTSEGMEYIVKIDNKHARAADAKNKKEQRVSYKGGAEEDVVNSINTDMDTDILSVVQEDKPGLVPGAKVYVVYHNDRPRVVPAY